MLITQDRKWLMIELHDYFSDKENKEYKKYAKK